MLKSRRLLAQQDLPSTLLESFLHRLKTQGSLIGPFPASSGFDSVLGGALVVTQETTGVVTARFTVGRPHSNAFANLHGGCTATLVDVMGTLALLSVDMTRPGVSVEMNQTFLRAASHGEELQVVGTVLKYGRTLGFTQVDLRNARGELVALGRHTKAFDNTNSTKT